MNLNLDPGSWARVSPDAVLSGSRAQARNVLVMALQDIGRLDTEMALLRSLLLRYRTETPLGHQPHMIAHEVDAALGLPAKNPDQQSERATDGA